MERDVVSFDEFLYNEKKCTRGEIVLDGEKNLETKIEEKILYEEICDLMRNHLKSEEYYTLCFRLGVKCEINPKATEKTLEQIGKELGMTREAVRQKERTALRKIRELIRRQEKNIYLRKKK